MDDLGVSYFRKPPSDPAYYYRTHFPLRKGSVLLCPNDEIIQMFGNPHREIMVKHGILGYPTFPGSDCQSYEFNIV